MNYQRKKLFHNESDFQFHCAWTIKEIYPKYEIKLEYRVNDIIENKNEFIDLIVNNEF